MPDDPDFIPIARPSKRDPDFIPIARPSSRAAASSPASARSAGKVSPSSSRQAPSEMGPALDAKAQKDVRDYRARQTGATAIRASGFEPILQKSPRGKDIYVPGKEIPKPYQPSGLSESMLTTLLNEVSPGSREEGIQGLGYAMEDPGITPGAGFTRAAMGMSTPKAMAMSLPFAGAPNLVKQVGALGFGAYNAKGAVDEFRAHGNTSDAWANAIMAGLGVAGFAKLRAGKMTPQEAAAIEYKVPGLTPGSLQHAEAQKVLAAHIEDIAGHIDSITETRKGKSAARYVSTLEKQGFETVKDAQGNPIMRNGKPVVRPKQKGTHDAKTETETPAVPVKAPVQSQTGVGRGEAKTPDSETKAPEAIAPKSRLEKIKEDEATPRAASEKPAEPPKNEPGTQRTPEMTSARKLWMDEDRAGMGQSKLPPAQRKAQQASFDNAIEKGYHEQAAANALSDSINKKPRALDDEETAGLVARAHAVKLQHEATLAKGITESDPEKLSVHREALNLLEEEFDKHSRALRSSGTEKGRALAAQKLTINRDYSLINIKSRAKLQKGADLSPNRSAQYDAIGEQHKVLSDRIASLEKEAEAQKSKIADMQAERAVKRMIDTEARATRSAGRAAKVEGVKSQREAVSKRIQQKLGRVQAGVPVDIIPDVVELARTYVAEGVTKTADLVDKVHGHLSEYIEDLDVRSVRDAISGYGVVKKGTADPTRLQLAQNQRAMRLISQIEDVQAKQKPSRSGFKPPVDNPEVTKLRAALDVELKKSGIDRAWSMTPEQRIKSLKTRMAARISDLERRIKESDFSKPAKPDPPTDPALTKMKAQRDRLQKQYDAAKAEAQQAGSKFEPSLKMKQNAYKASLEKRIADLDRRLKAGDFSKPKTEPLKTTAEIEKLKAERDRLKTRYDALKPPAEVNPAARLKSYKTLLQRQITTLEDKVKRGDTSPSPARTSTPLDAEAASLKKQRSALQYKMEQMIAAEKQPHPLDYINALQRFAILSGLNSAEKIGIASVTRSIGDVGEGVFGDALAKAPVMRDIAARAPGETPIPVKAHVDAFVKAWTNPKDWVRKATGKPSAVDMAYYEITGKHPEVRPSNLALKVLELPGQIHGAIKLPAQRAAWERGLTRRATFEMKQGADLTAPATQIRIAEGAYQDSLNAIFRGDNIITDAWNGGMRRLDQYSKTGNVGVRLAAKAVQVGARLEVPIVRIPTNIASESLLYGPGGLARAAIEVVGSKGIKNLNPAQAELVMRATKKGLIGTALCATVWYNADKVKVCEKDGDIGEGYHRGDMSIMGHKVLNVATHHPAIIAMKITANARKAYGESDGGAAGLTKAFLSGSLETAKEIPFVGNIGQLGQATRDEKGFQHHIEHMGKSFVQPDLKNYLWPYEPPTPSRYRVHR